MRDSLVGFKDYNQCHFEDDYPDDDQENDSHNTNHGGPYCHHTVTKWTIVMVRLDRTIIIAAYMERQAGPS